MTPEPDFPTKTDIEDAASVVMSCAAAVSGEGRGTSPTREGFVETVRLVLDTAWRIRASRLARTDIQRFRAEGAA